VVLSKLKAWGIAISTFATTVLGLLLALSISKDRKRRLRDAEDEIDRYDREKKNEDYVEGNDTASNVADLNRMLGSKDSKD
jgi:hypothetical protein